MSMLWNRAVMGRSSAFRTLLLRTKPSIVRDTRSSFDSTYPIRIFVANYHNRFPQPSTKQNTGTTERNRMEQRETDIQPKEGLTAHQEALHKLGIVNDTLRSSRISVPATERRRQRQRPREQQPSALNVRVRSVHAAQTFDVVQILSKVFSAKHPLVRHHFGKTSLIVQLKPAGPGESFRFVAIYRFGSVVFFNMSAGEAGKILESIKIYGTKSIAAGFERRENFSVIIQPHPIVQDDDVVTGDYCVVESLDMNSVSVIANIMAQTVALDSYNDIAEELLENFAAINTKVRQSGTFTEMEKNGLFRVVAQNNSIFIDMISKLGIKERSDTAWNLSQYAEIHEGMKEEFEIEDRFDNIEFKLDMIQENAKFFLEILHNQKSNTLEWVIIVLILFECILMCLEMSGMGTEMFSAMPEAFSTSKPDVPPSKASG